MYSGSDVVKFRWARAPRVTLLAINVSNSLALYQKTSFKFSAIEYLLQ